MGLFKYLFGAREPLPELKSIGYVEFHTNYTMAEGNVVKLHHIAVFHMSADGEHRKVNYITSPMISEWEVAAVIDRHPYKVVCELWLQGGPFPERLIPFGDTLGEMLTRLVTAKLDEADATVD